MRPGNAHAPALPDRPIVKLARAMKCRQAKADRERPRRD